MVWVLLWVVLALGAAAVFFLVGRNLWRSAVRLTSEMTSAADRLSEVADRLADQSSSTPPDVRSQGSSPRPQR